MVSAYQEVESNLLPYRRYIKATGKIGKSLSVTVYQIFLYVLFICRVMVLEAGLVKEFDKPQKLLDDPNSLFYSMAVDANII